MCATAYLLAVFLWRSNSTACKQVAHSFLLETCLFRQAADRNGPREYRQGRSVQPCFPAEPRLTTNPIRENDSASRV